MERKPLYKLASFQEVSETALSSISSDTGFDAVLLNTNFDTADIGKHTVISDTDAYIQKTLSLIDKCSSKLKDGGLVFIYGLPNYLSFFGEYLSDKKEDDFSYLFKYWIACEFQPNVSENSLPAAHIGLLMYLKSKKKTTPTPFDLNTKFVRIPYSDCQSCKKTTKDWGGKKHLINPLGSALSDVWSFFDIPIKDCQHMPAQLIERILALLSEGKSVLKVNQTKAKAIFHETNNTLSIQTLSRSSLTHVNHVVHKSCIDYLNDLHEEHPEGIFDLAFADPPYNLAKSYSKYQDDLEEKKYIHWCNEWLLGMYKNLKPGGALIVLNIPKWSIYHFNFLADKMVLGNWIVWDALSTPAGKFLPAHYSLLYFTKPGGAPTINLSEDKLIDSRIYCLRSACVNKRKMLGDDKKELLTDIWRDVHRIKHKKDRDHHPCQLPTKLMERIIKTFTKKGDLVFDPFGGAGTTAIAAKLLNRKYIITELDEKYVSIANKNLSKVQENIYGSLVYERESVNKPKSNTISRKQIENAYMSLCYNYNTALSIDELKSLSPETFSLIVHYSGDFNKLQAATKRKIEATLFLPV